MASFNIVSSTRFPIPIRPAIDQRWQLSLPSKPSESPKESFESISGKNHLKESLKISQMRIGGRVIVGHLGPWLQVKVFHLIFNIRFFLYALHLCLLS